MRRRPLMYIADSNKVLVLPEPRQSPPVVARITVGVSGAYGLCVDRDGNLYVANHSAKNITVYRPGSLTPFITYSGGLKGPMYPVVDHDGNIYVSDGGRVVEFLRGQPGPYRTLQPPGYETDGIALDKAGNLYVTYRLTLYAGSIDKFPPGSTQGQILGMQIVQPQGLVVTDDGTIIVVQTGPADGVYVFPPGSQRPNKFSIDDTPVQLALTEPEHKIFLSAWGDNTSGRIYVATYPFKSQRPFQTKKNFFKHHRHRFATQGMAVSNQQTF